MSKMGYNGDAAALFKSLDADRSGELSLEEIDAYASGQWRRFRAFCVQSFEDPEDMVRRLGKKVEIEQRRGGAQDRAVLQGGPDVWTVTQAQFTDNVRALGWSSGYEDMIFPAMNVHDKDAISVEDLKWLEMEQRRQKRKELAKKKALQEGLGRSWNVDHELQDHVRIEWTKEYPDRWKIGGELTFDAESKSTPRPCKATWKDGSGTAWLLWCDEISVPDSCFLELSYKEKKLDPELALEVQGVGDGATLTLLKTKGRSVVG
eukprot:s74_g18.t1